MAIDTDALASIGGNLSFDPAGAQAKALSIKDMMDREQLSKLQVTQAKQDAATNTKVQELLKGEGVDYSNPEGVMRTAEKINKISPRAAMEFQTQAQKYSSGKVQNQVDQYELLDHQQGVIVSTIDPIVAQAREMKNKGADDMTVNAFIQQQLPGAIQNLQNTKLPNGQSALSPDVIKQINESTQKGPMTLGMLEGFEQKSKAGQQAIRGRLEQLKADTSAAGEREKERHNQATEDLAADKEAHRQREGEQGVISDQATDLAVDRILNGEKAQDVLANFGRGKQGGNNISKVQNRLAAVAKDRGIDAAEIAARNIELKGLVKEEQTESAIAGKIVYAEKEINKIGPQVLELSQKVPRGQFVPWNKLQNYSKEQLSDPNLKQLKAYLTTLSNSYDVLGGRGGTDVEKRAHNRELLNAADSPEALKAAVDAIVGEANLSHEAATESTTVDRNRFATRQAAPGGAPGPVAPVVRPGQGTSGPPAPANAPRAVGPNGHEIVYNGQAWVDAQTGKPIG
jgi:hypothetical protein